MANSLTKADYVSLSETLNEEHNVTILNPLSNDLGVMRQSLLFSGLESVVYNLNRKNNALKFFEFGKSYYRFENSYEEQKHLTLFVTGNRTAAHWNIAQKPSDFFYVKGISTALLQRLGIQNIKIMPVKNEVFSEGISLNSGKVKLMELGLVKRAVLKEFNIKQEVLFADFNWENVLKLAGKSTVKVSELPKFPSVKRDFALLLNKEITFVELYNLAFQAEKNLLKEVDLFDVYEGENMEEGKKSYAVSFMLQDETKTLTDVQIDKVMQKLQQTFEKNIGAILR
jgi:phenylalanyl-tRNA synthetase beta chain